MSQSVPGKGSSKIFLVGMPGCGKSTVGKLLANQLGWQFLDLDTLIEEQEGKAVTQVFEQRGQEYFRQVEASALRGVAGSSKGVVLATGGGAACFHDNMSYMNAHGTSVYLKVTPQELVNRLTQQDLELRPLLRGKSEQELIDYLTQTLTQREPFYKQASYTLEVGSQTAQDIADSLSQSLSLH